MDLLGDLQWRGLINQTTDINALHKLLQHKKITFYAGFDPSSDSLHLGNLLLLITAKRFQKAGHKPIILVGGATGIIGDPSDKKSERKLLDEQTIKNNIKKITSQIKIIFDSQNSSNKTQIVNNYDWFQNITFLNFMRDVGKYFSVNYLLAREWVKTRLDSGISFAEFGYSLIQAYDYFILNQKYDCELEIGGSDQWGNMIGGVDLIKNKTHKEVHALSIPLLLRSDGTKFGKSETNCIYLDYHKTTPYQMYQYLLNTDDRDIIKFLKQFTFLNKTQIDKYEQQTIKHPELREAQKFLAKYIVKLIHGEKTMQKCEKISDALFYGNFQKLNRQEIEQGLNEVPTFEITNYKQINIIDLLVLGHISSSKRQAKEDITNKAITINGKNISNIELQLTKKDCLLGIYLIIRRGKKTYFLGKWI